MQAHQEWRTSEANWNQKLVDTEITKQNLESVIYNIEFRIKSLLMIVFQEIARFKTEIQRVIEEKQLALLETKNARKETEEVKSESLKLKELNEQILEQIQAVLYVFILFTLTLSNIFYSISIRRIYVAASIQKKCSVTTRRWTI